MSVASRRGIRSTTSQLSSKSLCLNIFLFIAIFWSCSFIVTSFFSNVLVFSEVPFLSLPSVVSWFIRSVSTDTGGATQKSQSLPKFHEFVEHLCNIVGQNKGHNHFLLFRKACLSLFKANDNNNGASKKTVAWMGQLINDKAQSNEVALSSIAAATASLR